VRSYRLNERPNLPGYKVFLILSSKETFKQRPHGGRLLLLLIFEYASWRQGFASDKNLPAAARAEPLKS
jgi:hypothetical protein